MNQLVFYWKGMDIQVPTILVKSALLTNDKDLRIIQISDQKSPRVEGVNDIVRINSTENILMDRLHGYGLVNTKNNKTLFLDADTIILKKINFHIYNSGTYFYKRTTTQMFNTKYNEQYPELANKLTIDTMPFLAGIVFIINQENFFINIFEDSKKLNKNLKKWFGDQFLLKKYYDNNHNQINLISENFIKVIETDRNSNKIKLDLSNQYNAVTFKGSTKKYMQNVFRALIDKNYYEKNKI